MTELKFCPIAEKKALCDACTIAPKLLKELERLQMEPSEYQSTGLSPAEVAELKLKIERLRAKVIAYEKSGLFPDEVAVLARAKKEGRLAVWPRGEIGDYVEWDNGIETQLFEIHGILIRRGEIRYDLGDICPLVDSQRIKKIVPRDEVEASLKERENKGKQL